MFSIMLWLVYDCFCDLKLHYDLVVWGTPNLIELCYFLAYNSIYSVVLYNMVYM